MKRLLSVAAALLLVADAHAARRRAVRSPDGWTPPQCAEVSGFPAVAVSLDGGATVLPQTNREDSLQIHTYGLTATSTPNVLRAITGRVLLVSTDGGCSWDTDTRLVLPEHLYRFTAREWAWSNLGPALFRIGANVEQRIAPVPLPLSFFAQEDALAIADDQGAIWWSDDAGATWQPRATAPARAPLYALEFASREHAIATGMADGAHVTFDGGATWTRSSGVEGLNLFRVAFSPVDANVVWAMGLNPKETPVKRAIYLSKDGGKSFRRVLTTSNDAPMSNATRLAPSPVDASLVYFTYAGTTLVLLDATGAVRQRSVLPHRDVESIIFSPASPAVMYLGLHLSDMS